MRERLPGSQSVLSDTTRAALLDKVSCCVKALGCCIVAAAAMSAVGANATMTTKKSGSAEAKKGPAEKEAPGTKKMDAVKGAEGVGAQDSKLAPSATDAKKQSPK